GRWSARGRRGVAHSCRQRNIANYVGHLGANPETRAQPPSLDLDNLSNQVQTPAMTPIRHQLLELILDPDTAYDQPASDIAALQLRAAHELFEERRARIPLLARRAGDAGITRIASLADLVPLLFAHTVYKSYPPSFIEHGRWD